MAATTVKKSANIIEDIDLILNATDDDFQITESTKKSVQAEDVLTDGELKQILDAPMKEQSDSDDDSVISVTELNQTRPPPSLLRQRLQKPYFTAPKMAVVPEQNKKTPPSLFSIQFPCPPININVALYCRQELKTFANTLYLGSVTTPYLPECLRHARTYHSMLAQAHSHVQTLRPFNKLKPYFVITLTNPSFTFVTDKAQAFTITEKSIPTNTGIWIPKPFFSGDQIQFTLTVSIDIHPIQRPQTFSTDFISPFSRLGPPKRERASRFDVPPKARQTPEEEAASKRQRILAPL
jgi:hypothetical protein